MNSVAQNNRPTRVSALLGIGAGLSILLIVLIPLLPRLLSSALSSTVSRKPPPFAIELLSVGTTLTEASLPGKVTVLDFWAHWCRPCRQSLARIDAVARHFAGDSSVAIVAVNIDWSDGPEPIELFLREAGITAVPVGRATTTPNQQSILEAFGGSGIPYFVIIDKTGTIRYEHRGFLALENIDTAMIKKIEELRDDG